MPRDTSLRPMLIFDKKRCPTPFLQTATNPESGTVTYTYDSQNRLAIVMDAKSQRRVMV